MNSLSLFYLFFAVMVSLVLISWLISEEVYIPLPPGRYNRQSHSEAIQIKKRYQPLLYWFHITIIGLAVVALLGFAIYVALR